MWEKLGAVRPGVQATAAGSVVAMTVALAVPAAAEGTLAAESGMVGRVGLLRPHHLATECHFRP